MMEKNKLYTVEEVAEFIKTNPETIYRWARDKSLPSIRFGRIVRIRGIDILETFGLEGRVEADKFYTPEETASIFKISNRTIYRWIQQKVLRGTTVGTIIRIRGSDLLEAMGTSHQDSEVAEFLTQSEPQNPEQKQIYENSLRAVQRAIQEKNPDYVSFKQGLEKYLTR